MAAMLAQSLLALSLVVRVYDAFGDYRYAFFTAAALALVALGSLTMARVPQPATAAAPIRAAR